MWLQGVSVQTYEISQISTQNLIWLSLHVQMMLNTETRNKIKGRILSRSVALTQKTMRKLELRAMLWRGLPRQCSRSTMKRYLDPWRPRILRKWWDNWQKSVMCKCMRRSHSHCALLSFLSCTMTKEDTESILALATAGLVNWQGNDSKNTHTNTHMHIRDK